MQRLTTKQAAAQFDTFIDMARSRPVELIDNDQVIGVLMPASDYNDLRMFYADRLIRTMESIAVRAAAAGLTQEKLDDLLADES